MKSRFYFPSSAVAAALVAASVLVRANAGADDVRLELMSAGAMPKLGGYIPQRITLSSTKPENLKKVPADLSAPLYGELKLGPSDAQTTYFVIVDEPENKPARLFVDTTGSGEVTEASSADWKPHTSKSPDGKELTMYQGGTSLKLVLAGETLALHVPMYRFDKNDPQRTALKDNLFYYSDYARAGDVTLGGKSYHAMLVDDAVSGDFRGKKDAKTLLIDLNNDGKFHRGREAFDVNEPFNIGGTTYEIQELSASGASFQIVRSDKSVAETKPAADLSAGQKALAFNADRTDGKPVKFPSTYKGKLVMLDFWATWCGPCRAEIPGLSKAYKKFHDQGFEVLGISLDQPKADAKLAEFTKTNDMPWPQVYDGKFWEAQVAKLYEVDSIPRAFLVDGDTGMIVAAGEKLRGEELEGTVESALAKKQKPSL